jgi:hypothetical protein
MAFDPTTAKPVGGFDPSTAKPFDVASAIPEQAPTANLGDSFVPIGDLPPDFGEAKVQPGEISDAAPVDIAKTLGSLFLSPVAQIAGGAAGLGTSAGHALGLTDKTGADVSQSVQGYFDHEPTTDIARGLKKGVSYPFEKLHEAGDAAGEVINRSPAAAAAYGFSTGNPLYAALAPFQGGRTALATAASTATDFAPYIAGEAIKARQAPTAPELAAQESVSVANPPPAGAESLKPLLDEVAQKIHESTQPPPVPQPVTPAAPPVRAEWAATPKPRFTGEQVARGEHLEAPDGPAPARPVVEGIGNAGADRLQPDRGAVPPSPQAQAPAEPVAQAAPPQAAVPARPTADAPEGVPMAGSVPDAAGEPRVEPKTIRLYHGGTRGSLAPGDTRWLTQDLMQARGYATKAAGGGQIYYTDVAADHPEVVRAGKAFDDEGTSHTAPINPFEASRELTSTLRPLDAEPAAQPVEQNVPQLNPSA